MSKPKSPNAYRDEQFLALGILIVVPLVAGLLLLGEARRNYISTFLFELNRGAFLTTALSLASFLLIAVAMAQKKAKVITEDLKDSFASFQKAREVSLPKPLLFLPHAVLFGTGFIIHLVNSIIGATRWRWVDITKNPEFAELRGALDAFNLFAPPLAMLFLTIVLLNGSGLSKRWRKRLLEKRERELENFQELPEPPKRSNKSGPSFVLGARESRDSFKFEPTAKIPSWVEYRAPETYGGMCIFGMKGSGKSQLILRLIDQFIEFKADDLDRKLSLCVIDVKGDLTEFIKKKAAACGRERDVVHLGIETLAHWNPIGHLNSSSRFTECRQIGYFLRSAMSTGGSQGGDNNKYWEDNADNLCARTLHILALAGQDVNFANVYSYIAHLSSSDDHSVEYRHKFYEDAQLNVNTDRVLSDELKETKEYFEEEFIKLDSRVRTIVINVASNFLQKFLTTEYKVSFGRKPSDPNHFIGFKELIARGSILVLDIRSNEHGTIANALATLCKLSYMAAVKTRDRYANDKNLRKTALVLDEYQGYVTPSSSQTEGDDKYFETSRSFGAIDIVASQLRASLVAVCGEHMASRILNNFNTVITFKHNDPTLTDYMSKLAGTEEVYTDSISIQEGSQSTKLLPINDESHSESDHSVSRSVSFSKKEKQLIDANLFRSLTQFEAVGMFDGFGARRFIRFYVKPVFCPLKTPHHIVMKQISEVYDAEEDAA